MKSKCFLFTFFLDQVSEDNSLMVFKKTYEKIKKISEKIYYNLKEPCADGQRIGRCGECKK